MKKICCLLLGICLLVLSSAQERKPASLSKVATQTLWKRVDSLVLHQLPLQAEPLLNELRQRAIQSGSASERVKIWMTGMKLNETRTEEALKTYILQLEAELAETNEPLTQIGHSVLARLYKAWFYQNRNRMVQQGENGAWSRQEVIQQVINHYRKSLSNAAYLQQLSTQKFTAMLEPYDQPTLLRPTLYDVLAQEAVEGLRSQGMEVEPMAAASFLSDKRIWLPAQEFSLMFIQEDNNRTIAEAYRLLQEWTRFRLTDVKNSSALLDLERMRMHALRNDFEERHIADSLYFQSIQRLMETTSKSQVMGDVLLDKANFIVEKGSEWFPGKGRNHANCKALELVETIVQRFPKSRAACLAAQLKGQILSPFVQLQGESVVVPQEKIPFLVTYRNLTKVNVHLFRVDESLYRLMQGNPDSAIQKLGKPLWVKTIDLPDFQDKVLHTAEVEFPIEEQGRYVMAVSDTDGSSMLLDPGQWMLFQASKLAGSFVSLQNDSAVITVFDRQNGDLLKGVEVDVVRMENTFSQGILLHKSVTNAQGKITFVLPSGAGHLQYTLRKDSDFLLSESVWFNESKAVRKEWKQLRFYTDRKIYRPGQTLYFKGVLLSGEKLLPQPGVSSRIGLFDANGNERAHLEATTNIHGSVWGSFVIPEDGFQGNWSIRSQEGSEWFLVESYKRPKFEIEWLPFDSITLPGSRATLRGKAVGYAGNPVEYATAKFKIQRQALWNWRHQYQRPEWVTAGTTTTDTDGMFQIVFDVPGDLENEQESYVVSVDVTDGAGETQSTQCNYEVSKGGVTVQIQSDIVQWEGTSKKWNYHVMNANGVAAHTDGAMVLRKVEFVDPMLPEAQWSRPDTLLHSSLYFRYGEKNKTKVVEELYMAKVGWTGEGNYVHPDTPTSPGLYEWEFCGHDASGKPLQLTNRWLVLSNQPIQSPIYEPLELHLTPKEPIAGGWLRFAVASGLAGAKVWVEANWSDGSVSSKLVLLRSSQLVDSIYIPARAEGIASVNATLVQNNRVYTRQLQASIQKPQSSLQLQLTTWRNKTIPGSTENWTLCVTRDSLPVAGAELLMTLYDGALDAFATNTWSWPKLSTHWNLRYPNFSGFSQVNCFFEGVPVGNQPECAPGNYPTLRWYGYDPGLQNWGYLMSKSGALLRRPVAVESNYMVVEDAVDLDEEPEQPQVPPQLRKDFSETAFFYPNFTTNDKGCVTFSFRVPEQVSRYRFLALAHTEKGEGASMSEHLLVQKEVMVQSQFPRFLRQGDRLQLRATVVSLTDILQKGMVTMEIRDASNQNLLKVIQGDVTQSISLPSQSSTMAQWNVVVPEGLKALVVRVYFQGASHSDGEEVLIPVLPAKVVVVQSHSELLYEPGKQRVEYPNFTSEKGFQELTFGYSASMTQEVLKALPFLMDHSSEGTDQLVRRGFAMAVGIRLAQSKQVESLLLQWRLHNQSMKSPLRSDTNSPAETPWLDASNSEETSRQRLTTLLNQAESENNLQQAWDKLAMMQSGNGSFPWFPGMAESDYITLQIASTLGWMGQIAPESLQNPTVKQMTNRLVPWLDRKLAKEYKQFFSNPDSTRRVGAHPLHLLYARSFYSPAPQDSLIQPFIGNMVKGLAGISLTDKSIAAVVLHRYGKKDEAARYLQSVVENLVRPHGHMAYLKFDAAVATSQVLEAQTLAVMAMQELHLYPSEVRAMQNWLITQKQTQAWPTSQGTVLAVAAVCNQKEALAPIYDRILIGKSKIVLSDTLQAATLVWSGPSVSTKLGRAVVDKKGENPSFISWRHRTLQSVTEVQKADHPDLAMERLMFVERSNNSGTTLFPVNSVTLKPGDVVLVRLVLKANRSMDFVRVKEMRSAALEPVEFQSGYRYTLGLGYYQTIYDSYALFFIDHLPKGVHTLEYRLKVSHSGVVQNGFAEAECLYLPEIKVHSASSLLHIGGEKE